MKGRQVFVIAATMVVAGCSSVAELTVKERTTTDGQRVLVGQAKPSSD